jgi:hypothetical protein
MNILRSSLRWGKTLTGLVAAALFTVAGGAVRAGEVQILNSNFDNLAPSPAWSWESWSLAGSVVTYDATRNAAGGAVGSGSLRLVAPYANNANWQQAVFTLDIADVNASGYQTLSFDVKVDPGSTPRLTGDYGGIRMILRDGSNWDWRQQVLLPLTNTSWQRYTVLLASGDQPITDIRALTIQLAENAMVGPVTVNVDNIAFNDEVIVDNFDDGNIDGWTATWGTTPELTYSPLDRAGRETSGSIRVAANYFSPTITTWQQAVTTIPVPETNVSLAYTFINVDVKVDPGSIASGDGDYGLFEIKYGAIGTALGGARLTNTDWTHLSFQIAPGVGVLNGLLFQLGDSDMLGPITYNLDNLTWTVRTAPPPPPTLSIEKAASGLNLVHTDSYIYGRHNIYSADSSALGFYNEIDPVSYSVTLSSFPDFATHSGFQAHVFLVPGGGSSATDPDYSQPNILFMDIRAGANQSGSCTFRWKTNQAGGNSQLYVGGLPAVNSASVLGTWKLTASGNTHFVMTAPDGTTTPFDLSADAAAFFSGPLRFYVGVQGNSANNIGQRAHIGGVKIVKGVAGDVVLLEDDFSGDALDTSKWVINAAAGGVQFLARADAGFLVTWGLPDDGYALQWRDGLTDDAFLAWTPVTAVPYALGPIGRQVHIPPTELLGFDQAFFRLVRP